MNAQIGRKESKESKEDGIQMRLPRTENATPSCCDGVRHHFFSASIFPSAATRHLARQDSLLARVVLFGFLLFLPGFGLLFGLT